MTVSEPRMRGGHLRHLDGLRAIAILLVLLSHLAPGYSRWLGVGNAGVQLFFVISGYLITHNLLGARHSSSFQNSAAPAIRAFYIRRVLRIFPVYFMALLIALIVGIVDRDWIPWLLTFSSNWRMAWTGSGMGPMSPYWSLAVEEQFYLLWPWLILFAPARRLPAVIVGTIVCGLSVRFLGSYLGWPQMFMYAGTLSAVNALGLGALVAHWELCGNLGSLERIGAFVPAAILLTAAAYAARVIWPDSVWAYQAFEILVGVTAAGLISTIARGRGSPAYDVLALRAVCYVGLISYGVYAYHMIIYECVARLFGAAALTPLGRIARLPAELLLILGMASLSYRFMESPINRLKKYFPYSARALDAPPTAHAARERADTTSVV